MDFRTSVELIPEYQLVLASQKRGTFFCVYAKFEPLPKKDKYKVSFFLKNYRGFLKIGIDAIYIENKNNSNCNHIVINLTYGKKVEDTIEEIELKKGELFIVERSHKKSTALSDVMVNEGEYINMDDYTFDSQYDIEKKEAKILIDQLKKNYLIGGTKTSEMPPHFEISDQEKYKPFGVRAITAASVKLCIVGISKLI